MLGGSALGETALCELLDASPPVVVPSSLWIDPKYHDAEPGRDMGNDRTRAFLNAGLARNWGNDR